MRADQDERGRGGEVGDGADDGRDEDRHEEEQAGDDRGYAGASAGCDSGGRFDVAGDGGGAGQRADDGGGGVGEEDAVEARDGVVVGDEPGALGDADQGADVVEEVDKEEDEDDFERVHAERAADVEMEGGVADGHGVEGGGRVLHLVEEDSGGERGEHADQHGGLDAVGLEHGDQKDAEDGELRGVRVQIAQRDGGGGAGDDDAGVEQADEGDEKADAARDRRVELVGDGGEEPLANAAEGKQKKDDAGEEDRAERGLPGDAHALDDGVGEVGVEAHAGSERERVVGQRAHQDGAEGGAEAGGGGDGGQRHAGLREDGGVDEDDVRHGDEGGEAGEDLGAPRRVVGREAKVSFQAGEHWGLGQSRE